MSTKIYDGLLIERDMTLQSLSEAAKEARPKMDAQVEAALLSHLARLIVESHDAALVGAPASLPEGSDAASPWDRAMVDLNDARRDNRKGLATHLPLDFEAAFFPLGGGRTLAMGFGRQEQRALFASLLGAKEHGYWDNSDEPELPEGEWDRRRADWEKALGPGMRAAPAEAGVVVKLVSRPMRYRPNGPRDGRLILRPRSSWR